MTELAEGGGLENHCARNCTGGSNPPLSAIILLRIEHKFLTIQKFLDIVKYEYYTNDIK